MELEFFLKLCQPLVKLCAVNPEDDSLILTVVKIWYLVGTLVMSHIYAVVPLCSEKPIL